MKGSGLGLAIARALIDLHRGSLRLRSRVGMGTVVLVRLSARSVVDYAARRAELLEIGAVMRANAPADLTEGALTMRMAEVGNDNTARSPGALSSNRRLPPCSRANGATRESPSPDPGSDRAFSNLTNRPITRSRSWREIPEPPSATHSSIKSLVRLALIKMLGFALSAPYLSAFSTRFASACPSSSRAPWMISPPSNSARNSKFRSSATGSYSFDDIGSDRADVDLVHTFAGISRFGARDH